ncbi:unnamed protein product [Rotaria sp. Silwood1]|nr:unnamed protein product [Rotaria sp. Silwood1]CAF1419923.1 unnamed protein product [Rotaria sp. Silwood1]CAF1448947.1 unnamed protein product [Rotaria sp. Silwood1]
MLVKLHIGNNQVEDTGAYDIASVLRVNTTLTELDLQNNKIGDQGALHLAVALIHNEGLQSLYLQQNAVGVVGGQHLVDSLRSNTVGSSDFTYVIYGFVVTTQTLTTLDVRCNPIGVELRTCIDEFIARNAGKPKKKLRT